MRTTYTSLLFVCFSFGAFAQDLAQSKVDFAAYAEKTKSGNYTDLFSSFLQLAGTQLTGKAKTIDFNSTLFELRRKVNPDLNQDVNYVQETFARNFQFNFKLNLDENLKYQGFTGGFTYAAYNGRDKSVARFSKEFDVLFDTFNRGVQEVRGQLTRQIMNDSTLDMTARVARLNDLTQHIISPYFNNQPISSTDAALVSAFTTALDQLPLTYVNSQGETFTHYSELLGAIHTYVGRFYREMEGEPLLTLSGQGSTSTTGQFNQGTFGLVYLQGLKGSRSEIDVRAQFTYADTITGLHLPTRVFSAKTGMNFKLGQNAQHQSYFEVKAQAEYHYTFQPVLLDEKHSQFMATSEIRLRISDSFWLPLLLKYDIEKANLFGFLNLTYNFDH